MKKRRVKILESISGLADPRSREDLDAKYKKLRESMEMQEKPPAPQAIEAVIAETKKRDRYGEVPIGFSKDWAFQPGDEAVIEVGLADKWEAAGLCVAIAEEKKAA